MSKMKQPKGQTTAPVQDEYNPVNIAGNKIGKPDEQIPVRMPETKNMPETDQYNPVKMVGKKTTNRETQRSVQPFDETHASLSAQSSNGKFFPAHR